MKRRQFSSPITFFVTSTMYQKLVEISDGKEISLSEALRDIIEFYFMNNKQND